MNNYENFPNQHNPTFDDDERLAVLPNQRVIRGFHLSTDCASEFCPVHNPSDHNLRKYTLDFDFQRFMFVRYIPVGLSLTTYPDPDDYNLTIKGKAIMVNSLTCNTCGTTIYSETFHNRQYCKCGETSVDGGYDTLRHMGKNYTDNSVIVYKKQPYCENGIFEVKKIDFSIGADALEEQGLIIDERFLK